MKHIGLESSSVCTTRRGGIQRYIISFIDSLLENEQIRSNYDVRLLYKISRYRERGLRHLPAGARAQWYYPGVLPVRRGIGLVHSLDSFAVPAKRAKRIGTVYDLAVFKSLLQDDRYSPERFRKKKWEKVTTLLKSSDAIVTLSENTKQDILEFFEYPAQKIHVIPPGIDPAFLHSLPAVSPNESLKPYGLNHKGYLLFVGDVSFRKNVLNLVHAYAKSGAADSMDLALAGRTSEASAEIQRAATKIGLGNRLKLLGHVPDEDLPALYNGSRGFLFPTFYEGFGIPILEAMACRTPVLVGNWGAAPEVAAGHAIMVDPFEIDSIAQGIKQLLDTASPPVEEAAQHAARFTWSASAERMATLYEKVLNE